MLIICLAGSMPSLKNELEPIVNDFFCQFDLNINKEVNNISQFEVSSCCDDEISIGALMNYKVPSNLSSLASCALLITVASNDWIQNSSAKSNHLFQGRFDGPFSFYLKSPKVNDHLLLEDNFGQSDMSHSTNPNNENSEMSPLYESCFCGQHPEPAVFGRGACFWNNWVGHRSTDTCS